MPNGDDYKYKAVDKKTGRRVGSNDGKNWVPIPAQKEQPKSPTQPQYPMTAPPGQATSIGPQPSFGRRVGAQAAMLAPVAAGTIGGIAGTTGGPAGTIGGATLGGAAGTALQQLIREAMGIKHPATSLEAAKEIGMGGVEQGAYQATGELAGRFLPWAKMFPGGRVAGEDVLPEDIYKISRAPGMKIEVGDIRGAPGGVVSGISNLGMLSQKGIQKYEGQTVRSAERLADDFLSSIAPPATKEQSGLWMQETLKRSNDAFKREGDVLFDAFRGTRGQSIPLDLRPIEQLASRIESQSLSEIPKESPAGQLIATMKKAGQLPGNFDTGMQIRDYLGRFRGATDAFFADKEAERLSRIFSKELSSQMNTDAARAGTNVARQWADARQFWSTGRNLFDSKVVKGIIKKNPEVVADTIKPGDVTDVKRLKQIITSYGTPAERARGADAWRSMQRAFAERRMILDPTSKEFSLKDLQGLKARMDKLGGPQLREMYSDPQGQQFLKNMRSFAELMSRTDFQSGLGLGKWRVLYEIVGTGGAAAATRNLEETVLGFVGLEAAPRILSAVLHSRTASGLLLKSIMAPPESKALATSIAQRIVATTVRELEQSQEDIYGPQRKEQANLGKDSPASP